MKMVTALMKTTWASTDYRLMLVNTTPKMWIAIKPNGNNTFPTASDAAVEVTGKSRLLRSVVLP